jgi:hypothetical protein
MKIELDLLIAHIGEAKARELARLARLPSNTGVAKRAFEELAKVVQGFHGIYGAPSDARRALEALMTLYPDELPCPFCSDALRGPDGLTGLQSDANGWFVICRHCERRVALEDVSLPGGPKMFRVAQIQK